MSPLVLAVLLAAPAGVGERIYREGVLPSEKPVEAVVQGDVAVTGAQLTCVACHGRSGMGSVEGSRVIVPITPPFLSAPRKLKSRPRPAYTRETLARAIRDGVDAGGNQLDRLMPRYRLSDPELSALVGYLETLSTSFSPGASLERLHVATIITPGADAASRAAMLAVLKTWVAKKNAASSANRGWHGPDWPEYYGDWVLHVWELAGAPSTWRAQLEAKLAAEPVFAVVSGLGTEWAPVHRFCEARALPCLLPNVDTPPGADGYYSLYFSRGLVLEAAAIARHVSKAPRVLQVVGKGGERAAAALREALGARVTDVRLDELAARAKSEPGAPVVLWLDAKQAASAELPSATVYLSSTLLGGENAEAPAGLRGFVAHPWALPKDQALRYARISGWLTGQGVKPDKTRRRIEDQTFFALTVLNEGVMHLQKNFYRDYLLELIDHSSGLEGLSTFYPRLSFGPGQRALSKGCYVVPLGGAGRPEWVVP